MAKIEVLKHDVYSQAVEHTYTLQHETEGVLIYTEWIDKEGVVVDFYLRSKNGYDIDDPELFDQVMEFLEGLIK